MNLRPHGPQPCTLPDCATSRKLLFVKISFDTPFFNLSLQSYRLRSIGTGIRSYQYPRSALGSIFFTTTVVSGKSFFNIVRLTHIIPVGSYTEQYVNNIFHYFKRPSRFGRDTLPDLSRSFAGTAPHPDTTICSILSILFSASPFLNESSVGQPVLSVVEGPHPENEIAKIGKIKQLNPKLLAKK